MHIYVKCTYVDYNVFMCTCVNCNTCMYNMCEYVHAFTHGAYRMLVYTHTCISPKAYTYFLTYAHICTHITCIPRLKGKHELCIHHIYA